MIEKTEGNTEEGLGPGEPEAGTAATDAGEPDPLERALAEKEELTALLQRVQADFVNYRKRVQTEQEETRKAAARGLVLRVLDVLDQFDNAMAAGCAAPVAGDDGGWLEGFEAIRRALLAALAAEGVEPYDSEGEPFDPREHEALLTTESSECPANSVVRVLRRGYRMHGEVLRAAQVEIATAPAEVEGAG